MSSTSDRLSNYSSEISKITGYIPSNNTGIIPMSQCRDSDLDEQSNFAVIYKDLHEIDINVRVLRFAHWACGWVENIEVPLTDKICTRIDYWEQALIDDPIADMDDLIQRQINNELETLEFCYDVPHEHLVKVNNYLSNTHKRSSVDDLNYTMVNDAMSALGIVNFNGRVNMDSDLGPNTKLHIWEDFPN